MKVPRTGASLSRALAAALGVALVVASLAHAPSLAAQARGGRHAQVSARFSDGVARLDVRVASFLDDAETRRKLTSGLSQTIQLRAYAYVAGRDAPVAVTLRSCRVAYDLWEERYRVEVATESTERAISVASLAEVAQHCLTLRDQPLGQRADWANHHGAQAYFAVLVELNPLTPDTLARIRRWLARPSRGTLESDSFFGSFVSLFVNRGVGDAERALRLRSTDVRVP